MSDRTDYSVPKDLPHPKVLKAREDALNRVETRMLEVIIQHETPEVQAMRVSDAKFFARFARSLADAAIKTVEDANP